MVVLDARDDDTQDADDDTNEEDLFQLTSVVVLLQQYPGGAHVRAWEAMLVRSAHILALMRNRAAAGSVARRSPRGIAHASRRGRHQPSPTLCQKYSSWYRKKGKYNIVPQKPILPGDCVGAQQYWHTLAQSLAYRICWRIAGHVLSSSMPIIYVSVITVTFSTWYAHSPRFGKQCGFSSAWIVPQKRPLIFCYRNMSYMSLCRVLDPCLCALTLDQSLCFEYLIIIVMPCRIIGLLIASVRQV